MGWPLSSLSVRPYLKSVPVCCRVLHWYPHNWVSVRPVRRYILSILLCCRALMCLWPIKKCQRLRLFSIMEEGAAERIAAHSSHDQSLNRSPLHCGKQQIDENGEYSHVFACPLLLANLGLRTLEAPCLDDWVGNRQQSQCSKTKVHANQLLYQALKVLSKHQVHPHPSSPLESIIIIIYNLLEARCWNRCASQSQHLAHLSVARTLHGQSSRGRGQQTLQRRPL